MSTYRLGSLSMNRIVRHGNTNSAWGLDSTPATDPLNQGRCKSGINPESMFPDRADQIGNWEAKVFCHGCPVRIECRTRALDDRTGYGVWGGLTEIERNRLHKGKADIAPCIRCGMDIVPAPNQKRCHNCSKLGNPPKVTEKPRPPRRGWKPQGTPASPVPHEALIVDMRGKGAPWREIAQVIGATETATKTCYRRWQRRQQKAAA